MPSYFGLFVPAVTGGGAGVGAATAVPHTKNGQSSTAEQQTPYVFREKSEALEVLKLHKDARLREFTNEADAIKFAQTGHEVVQCKYSDPKNTTPASLEKAAFRGPTKQELIEFRKVIEAADYERVKTMIWDNPRYLVSSGDTPTTLKEGYRYNAMHICAISKKPRIAELILQTVSDTKFVDLLTGKKNDQKMCKELCVNLLDYYLNIPEKGRSETPLHFAAKNGCVEMVEVLTSYPECKMTPNSEGLYPKHIICSRVSQASPEVVKKIESLLEERFYVPVFRSVDNVIPPKIGQPFSATNPPNLNCDPLSPEVKIEALAGPMNKEQAKQFCRRWKTPPRLGSNASTPVAHNLFISPVKSRYTNCTPVKSTQSIANNESDSPHSKPNRRALFNSTPLRAPACTNSSTAANVISEPTEQNGDTLIVDKQNGNHRDEENITANNTQSLIFETNNNNGSNTQEESSVQRSEMSILKNITSQNTPALHMKRQLFFTYRDPNPGTPVVNDGHGDEQANDWTDSPSDEHESDSPRPEQHQQPIKLKSSMLKTALCRKMPLFNDHFNTYREQNTASSTDTDCSNNSNTSLFHERVFDTPGFKERHIKITDTEKGLEVIGRELAKEQNVEWREYWDFLDAFIDIGSDDGLQKLENYFVQRQTEAEMSKKTAQAMAKSAVILDSVCNALEKLHFPENGSIQDGRNGFSNERGQFGNASTSSSTASTVSAQTTTPYTCVEKSVQVFAKRMTKTIIHNINNVVSINDTLLSELKRLKSLICSFKEDTRFQNVNFSKVHSRIGNLVAIYLNNSQEVTSTVKVKIQNIIQNLVTPGERREHIECVCWRILTMLESGTEPILPENLKTEEMCSSVWEKEADCECQWETNLSRKTSRRNRMEARYRSHQQAKQQFNARKALATAGDDVYRDPFPRGSDSSERTSSTTSGSSEEWRDPVDSNENGEKWKDVTANDLPDNNDDDVFWSDFGASDTDDEEEIWVTPPESPSGISLMEEIEEDVYKIFIYGNEPTKRDLDVLNAILHIDIDKVKYPNIHSWKTALLRFPKEDMDAFSSFSIIKKSHSFTGRSFNSGKKEFPQTPPSQRHQILINTTSTPITITTTPKSHSAQQVPGKKHELTAVKRLFSRPPFANIFSPQHTSH